MDRTGAESVDRDSGVGVVVVVADDRPVMRRGLVSVIEAGGADVAASVATAGTRAAVVSKRPDVLVTGHLTPVGPTLEAIIGARSDHPALRVLLLADDASIMDLRAVVRAGVDSVLLSSASEQEVQAAIRTTAAGSRAVSPDLALRLAGPWREQTEQSPTTLTRRELEVLQLLAEGMTNHEIGDRLSISPRTVKTHVQNLIGKLEVPDRTGAVAQGLRKGLIR